MPLAAVKPDEASVQLVVELTRNELRHCRYMLADRVEIELELCEDLQALGRPFDHHLAVAALAMKMDHAVEAALGCAEAA